MSDYFTIETPLIDKTKVEIIQLAQEFEAPLELTNSCYQPKVQGDFRRMTRILACGKCDSCILRRKGFEEAGVSDPTQYA